MALDSAKEHIYLPRQTLAEYASLITETKTGPFNYSKGCIAYNGTFLAQIKR